MPRRADSSGVAHVYVWTPLGEQKICAYFAICPTEVARDADGLPRSVIVDQIPAAAGDSR